VNGEGELLIGLDLTYEDAELIDQRLIAFLNHSGHVLQLLGGEGGGGSGIGGNGGYKPGMKARRREPHRSVLNDREDYASK
jgi:hypothetical protein